MPEPHDHGENFIETPPRISVLHVKIERCTVEEEITPMMRERTRIRIARAVALDIEGLKGPEIARRLGMRPKGLESLRARAEYNEQLTAVGNEMIRRMDEAIYNSRVETILGKRHPG